MTSPCEEDIVGKHKIYWCRACDNTPDPLVSEKKIESGEGVCVYGTCYGHKNLNTYLEERKKNDEVQVPGLDYTFHPKILKKQITTKTDAHDIPPPDATQCLEKEKQFVESLGDTATAQRKALGPERYNRWYDYIKYKEGKFEPPSPKKPNQRQLWLTAFNENENKNITLSKLRSLSDEKDDTVAVKKWKKFYKDHSITNTKAENSPLITLLKGKHISPSFRKFIKKNLRDLNLFTAQKHKDQINQSDLTKFIKYWDYNILRDQLKEQGIFPQTISDWDDDDLQDFVYDYILGKEEWNLKKEPNYNVSLSDYIEQQNEPQQLSLKPFPAYNLIKNKYIDWKKQSESWSKNANIENLETSQPDIPTTYLKTSTKDEGTGRTASVGKGEILFGNHLGLKPSGPNKSYDFIFRVNDHNQEADVKEADKDGSITTGKRGAVMARSLVSNIDDLLKKLSRVILDVENCKNQPSTCFSKYMYPKEINQMKLLVAKWINKGLHEFSATNINTFKNIINNLNYMKNVIQQILKKKRAWNYTINNDMSLVNDGEPTEVKDETSYNGDAVKVYKILNLLYDNENNENNDEIKLKEYFGSDNYNYIKFLVDLDHPYIDNPRLFEKELENLPNIFKGEWLIFVTPKGYYIMDNPDEKMMVYRITQGKPRFKPKDDKIKPYICNKDKKDEK